MKKSSFVAMMLGTASGVMFALGMCMALLPEWNAFKEGIFFGGLGLILGVVTFLVWCRMEHKKLPKVSGKNLLRVLYGIVAVLVLGLGMCMCLVWQNFVWGTVVGLAGILMLLVMIPMIKGLK
ncbi:MAG: hypothetical protein IJC71_03020 [Clostridia bacterium]|nr:hypothetical protein [Clostridia bacterium]